MNLNVKGKTILGVAAHPDDLDFGCAGAIAKFSSLGAKIYYLILTDGSRGSEDLTLTDEQLREIRHKEQKDAARVTGVKEVFFLDYPDGRLQNTEEIQRQVVRVIRKLKPNIVITTDPTFVYDEERGFINHPDHRVAGQIALDCVFPFSRNFKSYPELLEEGHEPHVVETVLLNNISRANFYVDISDFFEIKLEAIKMHVSQYSDFEAIKKRMSKRAAELGQKINVKYADGFVKVQPQP